MKHKRIADAKRRAIRTPAAKDAPKPIWNSLEIAKIVVGVFTSLSVVGLGAAVTISNANADRNFQADLRDEVSRREDLRERRADDKERKDKALARLEEERASDRAFVREQMLQREADQRELARQEQANDREDEIQERVRRQELALGVYNRKRELWASLDAVTQRVIEDARSMRETVQRGGAPPAEGRRSILAAAQALQVRASEVFWTFGTETKVPIEIGRFVAVSAEFIVAADDAAFTRLVDQRQRLEIAAMKEMIPPESTESVTTDLLDRAVRNLLGPD